MMTNPITNLIHLAKRAAAFGLTLALPLALPVQAQNLYVGDIQNDTVERLDTASATFARVFVHSSDDAGAYKMAGPRGMIFVGNELIVANQNANLGISGEILRFDATTGLFTGAFIPSASAHAPFAPRGIVLGPGHSLLVADLGNFDAPHPGRVAQYDSTGNFMRNLDTTGFPAGFYPRGLVMGPDGFLYVSAVGNLAVGERAPGYVLRFDPAAGEFVDVVADASSGLHRPEGLAFGPDGKLYVTTFLTGSDLDGVVVYDVGSKAKLGQINLWSAGQDRVYAQAILFGPGGDLFVPLSAAGRVRRYSAASGYTSYSVLPARGNAVKQPWYLTFRATNPSTLAYEP